MGMIDGLVQDNDYYQVLCDNLPIGIQIAKLIYDDQGEPIDYFYMHVNSIYANFLGLAKEEFTGKKATDFLSHNDPEWFSKYGKILITGKADRFEMFHKSLGRWFDVLIIPLDVQDEFAIIYTDITKPKEAEEELSKSKEEALALISALEKTDTNKNEFISILSHELRNPIATITGAIELMERINKKGGALNTIKILKRQVDQLSKLVDDLLDITQIARNKIILNKTTVNLNTIVKNAIVDIKPQYEEKGIKLLESICEQPVMVNIDSLRIAHCIGNILRNALKFTDPSGIVKISLRIEGKKAVIKVRDDGIGISTEMLTKIFEPYQQASNNSCNSLNRGLGLGLSIVKNIIEMHDGDVKACSPGLMKGSLFTMRLPIL